MWKGKKTKELDNLYDSYFELFGCEPDCYDEVLYERIPYEDYINYIKKALEMKEEFPDVIDVTSH